MYSPDVSDEKFEAFVHDLVARERAADEGSAEHRMIIRQLQGVCRTELGNLIVEDYEMSGKCYSFAASFP